MADEFSPERELPQHLLIARISAPIRHESAHRLGSIMHDLVQQGQAIGEIRDDVDAGLIARLLLTGAFYHFMWFYHPKDGHLSHGSPSGDGGRPENRDEPNALALEAKLIESVDALMDGLGGPQWRNS
jgi:hypothetical protein